MGCSSAGLQHTCGDVPTRLARSTGCQVPGGDGRNIDLDVDAIQERPRQPGEVAPAPQGCAGALQPAPAALAAGTGVGRQNELEGGGEGRPPADPIDGDRTGLQGLAQAVQDAAGELRRLVEEEDSAVSE